MINQTDIGIALLIIILTIIIFDLYNVDKIKKTVDELTGRINYLEEKVYIKNKVPIALEDLKKVGKESKQVLSEIKISKLKMLSLYLAAVIASSFLVYLSILIRYQEKGYYAIGGEIFYPVAAIMITYFINYMMKKS